MTTTEAIRNISQKCRDARTSEDIWISDTSPEAQKCRSILEAVKYGDYSSYSPQDLAYAVQWWESFGRDQVMHIHTAWALHEASLNVMLLEALADQEKIKEEHGELGYAVVRQDFEWIEWQNWKSVIVGALMAIVAFNIIQLLL